MVDKDNLKKFTLRFIVAFSIAAIIITTSVLTSIFGPSQYVYSDDDWDDIDPLTPYGYNSSKYNVVLDQHSHTLYSDGVLTVKQNIEWHIAMGFNVIFITDHNTLNHKEDVEKLQEEYKDEGILVLVGMEWTTHDVHMNFLGIDEWDLEIPAHPTEEDYIEAINEVHDQGGVVTVNHLPWSINVAGMEDHPELDDLFDWGVDYIEIINGRDFDNNSIDWWNGLSSSDQDEIGFIAGTDMHSPGSVYGWTFMNVSEFSEEGIMTSLRKHNETVLSYSSIGYEDEGEYGVNPFYMIASPYMMFGDQFVELWDGELDWIGVSIYVGYFAIIFGSIEVVRYLRKKEERSD